MILKNSMHTLVNSFYTNKKHFEMLNYNLVIQEKSGCNFFDYYIKIKTVSKSKKIQYGSSVSDILLVYEMINEFLFDYKEDLSYLNYFIKILDKHVSLKDDISKNFSYNYVAIGLKEDLIYLNIPISLNLSNSSKMITIENTELLFKDNIWKVGDKNVLNIKNYLLHLLMRNYSSYINRELGISFKYESIDDNYINKMIDEHFKVLEMCSY